MIVLWDLDGTLVLDNSPDGGLGVFTQALRDVSGHDAVAIADRHGKVDWQILDEMRQGAALPATFAGPLARRFKELSEEWYSKPANACEAVPGVAEALAAVHEKGWVNALITGNSKIRAQVKLRSAGYDLSVFDWGHSFFGEIYPNRAALAQAAARAVPNGVLVGDTGGDGVAANAGGFGFIAVTTGGNPAPTFGMYGPRLVIEDWKKQLPDFLTTVGSLAR
ncbi:MAG TPA: haloacid dehalogenase-like hydrolase [Gemmatimonadales bacterium]|nr:haloacid dehalogenase-like hydrolase [Gemmatimonadales bacterium]